MSNSCFGLLWCLEKKHDIYIYILLYYYICIYLYYIYNIYKCDNVYCMCVLCFVREKDDRPLDLNFGSSFWARSTLLLMDFPFPFLRSACWNSAKARRSKRNLAFFADDWLLPLFECGSLDISRSSINFFSWKPVCVLWYNCCLTSPLHSPILFSLSSPILVEFHTSIRFHHFSSDAVRMIPGCAWAEPGKPMRWKPTSRWRRCRCRRKMPSKRRAKKWRTGSHSVMVGESMIATCFFC